MLAVLRAATANGPAKFSANTITKLPMPNEASISTPMRQFSGSGPPLAASRSGLAELIGMYSMLIRHSRECAPSGVGNGLSCLERDQAKVVMRGLDPRIHAVAGSVSTCGEHVDSRIKSAHDNGETPGRSGEKPYPAADWRISGQAI